MEAQSPNHWTAREVPGIDSFRGKNNKIVIIDKFLLYDCSCSCCRAAAKFVLYIVWERQGPYIERGPDMGEIPRRHISTCMIEVGVGMQRDAHTGGLKAVQHINRRRGVNEQW